jgi:N-acetyltransferase
MKTYGRPLRRVFDEESRPAAKKRRVSANGNEAEESEGNLECAIRESSAAILSSPTVRRTSTVFSSDVLDDDDDGELSTPPSSPPETRPTPPPAHTHKPTFSFLKKRKRAAEKVSSTALPPLTEVNTNSVRTSSVNLHPPKKKAAAQPTILKQMQIDLGGEVRKTCGTCGMEYVPTNTEDVALHKKYHDMNSSGVDLGRAFVKANTTRWVYEAARFDEGYVVIVDRKSSPTAKNQAIKVLEVVNKDLSSTNIPDSVLWSRTEPPKSAKKQDTKEEIDRYKVFLHMKDSKCVGVCLTERIWESRPVKSTNEGSKGNEKWLSNSSSVSVGSAVDPAVVGISRVWTSKSSRRKGIAMDLLDCVVSNFIYGMEIPKEQIAFSQPTESGCRLAESFFGETHGWHVYNEE